MIRFDAINFTRKLNLKSKGRRAAIVKTNSKHELVISAPQPYNNLICLQEDDTQYQEDIEFVQKHGQEIVEELETLRIEILENKVMSETLYRLQKILEVDIGVVESPQLSALLTQIILRAEVELAKIQSNTNSCSSNS